MSLRSPENTLIFEAYMQRSNAESNWIVKNDKGYFSGHISAGKPSWKPNFKTVFTDNPALATKFTKQGAANLQANLFLMGFGNSDLIQV